MRGLGFFLWCCQARLSQFILERSVESYYLMMKAAARGDPLRPRRVPLHDRVDRPGGGRRAILAHVRGNDGNHLAPGTILGFTVTDAEVSWRSLDAWVPRLRSRSSAQPMILRVAAVPDGHAMHLAGRAGLLGIRAISRRTSRSILRSGTFSREPVGSGRLDIPLLLF